MAGAHIAPADLRIGPRFMPPIPTTILTGFLGAGKTTLLNRILQEDHGQRIAVIENEFGQENIDSAILVQDSAEQIVEMSNGCICCTVRGDLIQALVSLVERRKSGELSFDRIMIETTGLADPGPVVQTFFMDDSVARHYLIDAVITVVDAVHGMQQLDHNEEARRQAGFADRLLLSKSDLATPSQLTALTLRLKRINPRARIITADFGRVPLTEVIDLRGFNLNDQIDIDPEPGVEPAHDETHSGCSCAGCGHDHAVRAGHAHHTEDIAAFTFSSAQAFDSVLLEEFLSAMIQVYGQQMLRYKGVLNIAGADRKVVFQGVHQLMGSDMGALWGNEEVRRSKMVFIGMNLPKDTFFRGLEHCLV